MPSEVSVIIQQRAIVSTAKVLVNVGDPVMPDTPIARTEALPGKLWRIDIPRLLQVDPSVAADRLVVAVGDKVQENQIIAVGGVFFDRCIVRSPVAGTVALISKTRGLVYVREDVETGSQEDSVEIPAAKMLGVSPVMVMVYKDADAYPGKPIVKGGMLARFGKKTVTSPMYGMITDISATRGTITIEPLFKSQTTKAHLRGKVDSVRPGEFVEVAGRAISISGVWGLGGEACGNLHIVDGDLTEDVIFTKGAIIAASGTASIDALLLASSSGVAGVILGWLSSATAMKFAGGIKNMGVTGDEPVPFPIILTSGFLRNNMAQDVFGVLASSKGSLCSVRGVTHIRAGVVRPEILIFPD